MSTSAVDGPVLNLTRINREHMGEYSCVADNGVTPHKQRAFIVEVHWHTFRSFIKLPVGVGP
ncbi:Lachesin [Orchesella cincta]|uniref:Lachesin n=1 Tax=Orchesella cincta TaxID=48709 RepID=A0A1D2MTQ7_ORCCI|nr:Lachesin [Orchesella cincta]